MLNLTRDKKVKKLIGYNKHHKPIYKTITIKVKHPGYWKYIPVKVAVKVPVKVPVNHHYGHR